MALNTLESIRKWIDKIAELSLEIVSGIKISPNEMIVTKHKMVKQLIMLATPLLNEKDLEEIEEYFKNIKLNTGSIHTPNGWNRNVPIYSQEIDYDLDECIQGIEKALQETGHFMPMDDESSLF